MIRRTEEGMEQTEEGTRGGRTKEMYKSGKRRKRGREREEKGGVGAKMGRMNEGKGDKRDAGRG